MCTPMEYIQFSNSFLLILYIVLALMFFFQICIFCRKNSHTIDITLHTNVIYFVFL